MSTSANSATPFPSYRTTPYIPRHRTWPYKSEDFARQDETSDPSFYSTPRLVTHIDDDAISALQTYYAFVLPKKGRVLDLCSSWVSHFPKELEDAAVKGKEGGQGLEVIGLGMNKKELDINVVLRERVLQDLNVDPVVKVPGKDGLDATTCVVSVDYLTRPLEVLKSLRERTKDGGMVHLVISNRCFPTKAIARWLRTSEEERLRMVGDYLWFSGWRGVEIVEVTDGNKKQQGQVSELMAMIGMERRGDPLWVVRAVKVPDESGGTDLKGEL